MFGQVIIGPPGSGKTTYCNAIAGYLRSINRPCMIINLDPANEKLPYKPDVDINDLVTLENVMSHYSLGPNGALIYCMEYLEKNVDWLLDEISKVQRRYYRKKSLGGVDEVNHEEENQDSDSQDEMNEEDDENDNEDEVPHDLYVLIDLPGQAELFTHYKCVHNIVHEHLIRILDYRLCCVHVVDAYHCADASKYISVILLSLTTMINLELPHVNILSKIDLIKKENYQSLFFSLDYYKEAVDLTALVPSLTNNPFSKELRELEEETEQESKVDGCNLNDNGNKNENKVGGEESQGDSGDVFEGGIKEYINTEEFVSTRNGLFERQYLSLHTKLIDVIESFSLVDFLPCNLLKLKSMGRVLAQIDKANGYMVNGFSNDDILSSVKSAEWDDTDSDESNSDSESESEDEEQKAMTTQKNLSNLKIFSNEKEARRYSNSENENIDLSSRVVIQEIRER